MNTTRERQCAARSAWARGSPAVPPPRRLGGQRQQPLLSLPDAPEAHGGRDVLQALDDGIDRAADGVGQQRLVLPVLPVAVRGRGVAGALRAAPVVVVPVVVADVGELVRLDRLADVDRVDHRDDGVEPRAHEPGNVGEQVGDDDDVVRRHQGQEGAARQPGGQRGGVPGDRQHGRQHELRQAETDEDRGLWVSSSRPSCRRPQCPQCPQCPHRRPGRPAMEQVDAVRYASMPQNVFVGDFARYYDVSAGRTSRAIRCSSRKWSPFSAISRPVVRPSSWGSAPAASAVPLRKRGVDVRGIEISEDMIAEVHKKPGGGDIPITLGDFATTRAEGDFTLVYAVYHTLGCLLTQAEQVACFRNVAAHLEPGGAFLVEFGVPQLRRMQVGETSYLSSMSEDYIQFETYDFIEQRILSTEHWYLGERIAKSELHYRYAWPSELDLMAELAGLRLRDRWSDWSGAPFTNESEDHISIWEKP